MTLPRTLDVAVVGAGPAGIGTAVAFDALDVDYAVLERDRIGSSFRQWPDEMRLLTPSFPANAFGVRDLNAVTIDTSPALALDCEHPTGGRYADYLEAVAAFHELPVYGDCEVDRVVPDGNRPDGSDDDSRRFTLETGAGPVAAGYVVWAAGQYQYPSDGSLPGAEHAVHVSTVDSWAGYAEQWSLGDREAGATSGSETNVQARAKGAQSDATSDHAARIAADGAGTAGPLAGTIAGGRRGTDRITRAVDDRRQALTA